MATEAYLIALDDQGGPGLLDEVVVRNIFARHGVDTTGLDEVEVQDPDIDYAWTAVTGLGRGCLIFDRPAGRLIWRIIFDLLVESHAFLEHGFDCPVVGNDEALRRLRLADDWDTDNNAYIVTSPDNLG